MNVAIHYIEILLYYIHMKSGYALCDTVCRIIDYCEAPMKGGV